MRWIVTAINGKSDAAHTHSNYAVTNHSHNNITNSGSGHWSTAPIGMTFWKYEGENKTTYNIPTTTCFIISMKANTGRGNAIALNWTSGGYAMYINNLHDDTNSNKWTGWTRVITSNCMSLSGSTLTITTT